MSVGGTRRREGRGRRGLGWRTSTEGSWFEWWISRGVDVGGDLKLVGNVDGSGRGN